MPESNELIDVDTMMAALREELAAGGDYAPTSGGLSVDDLMTRLREELAAREQVVTPDGGGHGTHLLERWHPALPPLPAKQSYVLSELLRYSDATFVDNVYRTVLRRAPDPYGMRFYLNGLRSGAQSKVEVLAALRWSEEGIARDVHVDGLLLPFTMQKWGRKRFIGPFVRLAYALLRLPRLLERLSLIESAQAHEAQELGAMANRVSAQVEQELESLRLEIRALGRAEESTFGQVRTRLERIEDELELMVRKEPENRLDELYAKFEDTFRGDRELVRRRAVPYLPFILEAGAGTAAAPVVDLGAGRGEWLELLGEHGLIGRGIDVNRVFLEDTRARGLDVTEGDAVAALRAMPDGSAGAITAMHLVEHLPFEVLMQLLDEAHRVLKVGGVLILETPNPENVMVSSHWFYLDPTHRNPIPPQALSWFVGARGFSDTRIERLFEGREFEAPVLLADEVPGASSMNHVLVGYRAALDYAVIGWKK